LSIKLFAVPVVFGLVNKDRQRRTKLRKMNLKAYYYTLTCK